MDWKMNDNLNTMYQNTTRDTKNYDLLQWEKSEGVHYCKDQMLCQESGVSRIHLVVKKQTSKETERRIRKSMADSLRKLADKISPMPGEVAKA